MKKFFLMVLAVGILTVAGCKHDLTPEEQQKAEYGALKFAKEAGGSSGSCSGLDSDGDGYVTCQWTDPKGMSSPIVCAYTASGCKVK